MGDISRAAAVSPPVVGNNTWGIDASDVSTAVWVAVPDSWKNATVTFRADGEAFYIVFGDSSLTTVSATAKSTIASNAFSAQGSVPIVIEDGEELSFDFIKADRNTVERMAVIAATGTAANLLRIWRSSGPVVG